MRFDWLATGRARAFDNKPIIIVNIDLQGRTVDARQVNRDQVFFITIVNISRRIPIRGFNIVTLAVGPTEDPEISGITLTVDGAVHPIDQVTKQLHKLVNVIKIRDMEPDQTIAREMAVFKVTAAVETRAEVMQFAESFDAKIIDVSRRTLTIEVTGGADKIDAFERMIRPHGLVEMARTGEVAISRSRPEA